MKLQDSKALKLTIKKKIFINLENRKQNDAFMQIAKIAGVKCVKYTISNIKTNYICLMPTNTYGPNDNYHSLNSIFFLP